MASHQSRQHRRRGRRSPRRAATLIAYFDTSALFKLIVEERGSSDVEVLWDSATSRVSSTLLYAEARAALAAASRSKRASPQAAQKARADLERLWRGLARVAADEPLMARAAELAETLALRAYDAVHLASAEAVNGPSTVLVAADRALLTAARVQGLATVSLPA